MGWGGGDDEARAAAERRRAAEETRKKEERAKVEKEAYEKKLKKEREEAEKARKEAEAARAREEKLRKQKEIDEEVRKKAEREAQEAKKRAADAAERSRKAEEEAKKARDAAEKARQEREKADKEVAKLQEAVDKGIAPEKWPSQEEYAAAKAAIQYDKTLVHVAICGPSGSGKSSLINAFRGILDSDKVKGAAVGVTESTRIITRYPDPRQELPYSHLVWYDIPGAGTINVSDWQYFVDQKLFVFDFLIMVYDARFTKIDVGILENALRFKVPLFVVRSKADQHIENMIKIAEKEEAAAHEDEDDEDEDDDDYENPVAEEEEKRKKAEREKRCRERYIHETRQDFRRNLKEIITNRTGPTHPDLHTLDVYIVSSHAMYSLFRKKKTKRSSAPVIIDEERLVRDMKKAALYRSGKMGLLAQLVM